MLILSYFDVRMGPRVFLTVPSDLLYKSGSASENIDNIKKLLDRDEEGFFIHTFSPKLKTANLIFNVFSKWARGRQESVMLSAICSEEEPDYSLYENMFISFKDKITDIPDIYKAFYIESTFEEEDKVNIQLNYLILESELKKIDKALSIKPIETHGQLVKSSKVLFKKAISLPEGLIIQVSKMAKKNYFIVYRTQGKVIKIDMIPVDAEEVFSLKIIFGEKMTLPIIKKISEILSQHDGKDFILVFTTGICQEGSRCIYEAYINTTKQVLDNIMNLLANIDGIMEIVLELINLKSE
ncbi:MAG: hypothetical protein ACFFAS_00080 [Promethearchaeota archaeon]